MWTFYDFNDAGQNVFDEWLVTLKGRPIAKIKAKANSKIDYLRITPKEEWGDIVGPMTGDAWDKILHIRITYQNVQYRALTCYGPGDMAMTILMIVEERDDRLPPNAADLAQERRHIVERDGVGAVFLHHPA